MSAEEGTAPAVDPAAVQPVAQEQQAVAEGDAAALAAAAAAGQLPGLAGGTPEELAAQQAAWMAEIARQGASAAALFPGGFLPYAGFGMPGMPFGIPGVMGEGDHMKEEGEDDTEDDEPEDDDDESDDGRPKRRRPTRKRKASEAAKAAAGSDAAALAMLAGAAAKPGGANAAAVAAMQGQGLEHLWNMNGAGLQASASGLDLSKLTSEQQQHILHNEAAYLGITDEREIKKLRRKQSNRESARRSRLRKQAECEQLGRQVKDLVAENSRLKEEKMNLVAQIEILNAKLSMSSAFGAVHALGGQGGDASKGMQDMQGMAAAMAQAMQVNGGAALMGAGLGMPALDPKALEAAGGDPDAMAAAAAAAAAAMASHQMMEAAQQEQQEQQQ